MAKNNTKCAYLSAASSLFLKEQSHENFTLICFAELSYLGPWLKCQCIFEHGVYLASHW